jgi:hypothetical protein
VRELTSSECEGPGVHNSASLPEKTSGPGVSSGVQRGLTGPFRGGCGGGEPQSTPQTEVARRVGGPLEAHEVGSYGTG